jgi:hypothetical protein
MGRDDIRANAEVTLRGGWEERNSGTYDFVVDGRTRGFVWRSYDASGWVGRVFTTGTADPKQYHMATIEEAMIWVETTYALMKE